MVFMSALLSFKSLTLFPNECTSSCNSETRSFLSSINAKRSFSSCSCPPGSSCESWGLLQITYPDITLGQNGSFFSFIALYREMTTIHQEELKRFLINSSESKLPSSKAELFVLLSTISSWTRRLEAKAVSYEVSRAMPQDTLVTIRTG